MDLPGVALGSTALVEQVRKDWRDFPYLLGAMHVLRVRLRGAYYTLHRGHWWSEGRRFHFWRMCDWFTPKFTGQQQIIWEGQAQKLYRHLRSVLRFSFRSGSHHELLHCALDNIQRGTWALETGRRPAYHPQNVRLACKPRRGAYLGKYILLSILSQITIYYSTFRRQCYVTINNNPTFIIIK